MVFATTITSKWQMTIPQLVRQQLGLTRPGKVLLEIKNGNKSLKITEPVDFFKLAGTFKPKKVINAVKLRKLTEQRYERF